jgi:hypothetical protein
MPARSRPFLAHTLPFALVIAGLALVSVARGMGLDRFGGLPLDPMYWIYPMQTAACAAALLWFGKDYDFKETTWRGLLTGLGAGLLIFLLWISPQELFHAKPRPEGFDPGIVPGMTPWMLAARFTRLVVVVPLLEEIFWRGFLLRYLVREDFETLPFGRCSRFSFWAVAAAFTLVHQPCDWPAAFMTGILLNLVAVRTRSLAACVAAHAVANLALGLYICATRQWGFW